MNKPDDLFDRDSEWAELDRFALSPGAGLRLAVVAGRRRQGKSILLSRLCAQASGFYYEAVEGTSRESLDHLGAALGRHRGAGAPLRLEGWEGAVDAVIGIATEQAFPIVLDEFPYLSNASGGRLPSLIQAAVDQRTRSGPPVRLVLCGSAVGFMGKLLAGQAPLRGRARLELVVQPFDFRTAKAFWGIKDGKLALKVHSLIGGTPAYAREYVADDMPVVANEFDSWVCRALLNPARAIFREARYLLAEEPGMRDPTLYHSVLAAIASGNATRAAIGTRTGRKASDLSHPLSVLEDAGLIVKIEDAFRDRRPTWRITEPILNLYFAITRDAWQRLTHPRPGSAEAVWSDAAATFESRILGPHFEQLAREWTATVAPSAITGGELVEVATGTFHDPSSRRSSELDIVGFGIRSRTRRGRPVRCLGEAKLRELDVDDLERLEELRETIDRRDDLSLEGTRILMFSASGFAPRLETAARNGRAELIDLDRLYAG